MSTWLIVLLLILSLTIFFVIPFSLELKAEKKFFEKQNKHLNNILKDKEKK